MASSDCESLLCLCRGVCRIGFTEGLDAQACLLHSTLVCCSFGVLYLYRSCSFLFPLLYGRLYAWSVAL